MNLFPKIQTGYSFVKGFKETSNVLDLKFFNVFIHIDYCGLK